MSRKIKREINKLKYVKWVSSCLLLIVFSYWSFHNFKLENITSWDDFGNWWIDTYVDLFKLILSVIISLCFISGCGWILWKCLRLLYNYILNVILNFKSKFSK